MAEKTVYSYDEKYIFSGAVILDDTDKSPSGAWNIPARCTETEPPAEKSGFARVWNGETWENTEDHRGERYWLPGEGYGTPGHEVTEVGPLPEGATTTAPEQTEEEKKQAEAEAEAATAKTELREIAISAMMNQLGGGDLTESKASYQTALLSVSDEAAILIPDVFPAWSGAGVAYKTGDRVMYNGTMYKVLQDHTSQEGWTPEAAPSLFAKVLTSTTGEPLPWEQPGSTNPYMAGDRVTYNGKVYESTIDNNVWAPDAYPAGWKEITE